MNPGPGETIFPAEKKHGKWKSNEPRSPSFLSFETCFGAENEPGIMHNAKRRTEQKQIKSFLIHMSQSQRS